MTYDEYKKLYKEWSDTDSISRKDDIEEQISAIAEALFKRLREIYLRYGQDFVDDDDYRSDRGFLSFKSCNRDIVHFCYSDRWAYGGECMFGINVPMKYLDAEEWKSLEGRLRDERIKRLVRQVDGSRNQIEYLKAEIEKNEAELQRLTAEQETQE